MMLIGLSDHIKLSWEPPSDKKSLCHCARDGDRIKHLAFGKECLHHRIQNGAQYLWFDILFCHCHDPSCQCEQKQHLSPDPTEVIEVFKGIYSKCLCEVLLDSTNGSWLPKLDNWLSNHVCWIFQSPLLCSLTSFHRRQQHFGNK